MVNIPTLEKDVAILSLSEADRKDGILKVLPGRLSMSFFCLVLVCFKIKSNLLSPSPLYSFSGNLYWAAASIRFTNSDNFNLSTPEVL